MIREQNLQVVDAPNMAYDAVLTAGNFKPILFSTPMVQAILRNEKTQTRRLLNPQPDKSVTDIISNCSEFVSAYPNRKAIKPFEFTTKCKYKIGDILWVRETWQHTKCLNINFEDENYGYVYKSDGQPWEDYEHWTWKPSIFMPKEACRIFLKLKSIRVEKLNDISGEDAMKEGIKVESMWPLCIGDSYRAYSILWDKINGKGAWNKNPFVWVYEFERTNASFACS